MADSSLSRSDKSNPNTTEPNGSKEIDASHNHPHDSDAETDSALRVLSCTTSSDINAQQSQSNTGQHHHRRKRIRISPLTRVSDDSQGPCDIGANKFNRYATVPEDGDTSQEAMSASKSGSPAQTTCVTGPHMTPMNVGETRSLSNLITSTIDAELQPVILKYVRLESVVRCLELAGFCSPFVLACLDEAQIQRLEDFVSHTCSLIDSIAIREQFLGPIFAKYPEQFRLPAGTVCGLLLASAEIKRRYRRIPTANITAQGCSSIDVPEQEEDFLHEQGFSDMASQTEISVPPTTPKSAQLLSRPDLPAMTVTPVTSASDIFRVSSPSVSNSSSTCVPTVSGQVDQVNVTKLNPLITSIDHSATPNTVAMMAAAFQAAAVAASGSGYTPTLPKPNGLPTPPVSASQGNQLIASSSLPQTALTGAFPNDPSTVITTVQNAARLVAAVSGCTMQNNLQSLTSVVGSNSGSNNLGLVYDEEVIDLERLKQHSSASAVRLASRQFVNAHLIRGRDFDMEMEISVTPEGLKRVTGIFYCHLCREKRERTSAVRFSIARNRYPVLSNVLSHLKTHFQYRGQLFHVQPSTQPLAQGKSSFSNEPLLNINTITGTGLSPVSCTSASTNPLDPFGLSLNAGAYADASSSSAELIGSRSFMNNCSSVSQSNLIIKGEAIDSRPNPRIQDEIGVNSAGSDTRASLGSERSSPPSRAASLNSVPGVSTAALIEPSEGNNNCELLAENGLPMDLFTTQSSNGSLILRP